MKDSMLLITSKWEDQPSFKMVSIDQLSPFVEAIYMPKEGVLAVITKIPKQMFNMVPKVDDNGDYKWTKNKQPRPGSGKIYQEERRVVETFHEFYIEDKGEIGDFIKMFAVNEASFSYGKFLVPAPVPKGEVTIVQPPLVDKVNPEKVSEVLTEKKVGMSVVE